MVLILEVSFALAMEAFATYELHRMNWSRPFRFSLYIDFWVIGMLTISAFLNNQNLTSLAVLMFISPVYAIGLYSVMKAVKVR